MNKICFLLVALAVTATAQQRLSPVSMLSRSDDGRGERADTVRTYHLPEVLVTATRFDKNPSDVGRGVTVIPRDQVRALVFQSVGEVLAQHEGIYLVGIGQNPGMIQSIFMRGASNNQTTILIDDIRVTDPSAVNSALDLSELSFAGLDRVEIVRGSHSTLYGSSAIGGVVNIITQKSGLPGLHADAEMRGGVFGRGTSAFSQNLSINYTSPVGLYMSGEVSNSTVRGLDATVDTVTNLQAYKNRDRDGFKKRDLWGKVGFQNDKVDLYASFKNTRQTSDLDKTAYIDDDNYTLNFRRNLLTYGVSYKFADALNLKVVGGYSEMSRLAVDDSSVVDSRGTTDHTFFRGEWKGATLTNEIQSDFRLPGVRGVIGAGLYEERMSSKSYFYSGSTFGAFESQSDLDTLQLHTTTTDVFAHVELSGALIRETLNKFALALGARMNNHSAFGTYTTYEINPSLKINGGALVYASYSTGFNAPSLYQLFAPERDFTTGMTRGNSDLQPEKSASYEIGFKQSAGTMSFSVSYFHTIVENSIEYVYLWDKNIGIDTLGNDWLRNDFRGDTYLNVGRQTTNGIEISLSSQISDRLWLSDNFSLVSGKLSYSPSEIKTGHTGEHHVQIYSNGAFLSTDVQSSELVRRPNTANVSMTFAPIENLTLKLDVRYVGKRTDVYYDSKRGPFGALGAIPIDEYTLVDVSQRLALSDSFSVNARVENLFNVKYSEINGFTTRGRGFYLSARYALDSAF